MMAPPQSGGGFLSNVAGGIMQGMSNHCLCVSRFVCHTVTSTYVVLSRVVWSLTIPSHLPQTFIFSFVHHFLDVNIYQQQRLQQV